MAILMGEPIDNSSKIRVVSLGYLSNNPPNGWYQVNNEDIPEYPRVEVGKAPVMYFDTDTKEFTFEIVDRPLTETERLQQLLDDAISLLQENGVI